MFTSIKQWVETGSLNDIIRKPGITNITNDNNWQVTVYKFDMGLIVNNILAKLTNNISFKDQRLDNIDQQKMFHLDLKITPLNMSVTWWMITPDKLLRHTQTI